MKDLNFNIYAMAKPKGPEAIIALLREFHAEASILEEHIDNMIKSCEDSLSAKAVADMA